MTNGIRTRFIRAAGQGWRIFLDLQVNSYMKLYCDLQLSWVRPYLRGTISPLQGCPLLLLRSQGCALGYPIAPRWGFAGSGHASPEGAGSPQPCLPVGAGGTLVLYVAHARVWRRLASRGEGATPRGACDPTIQALKERNDATPLRRGHTHCRVAKYTQRRQRISTVRPEEFSYSAIVLNTIRNHGGSQNEKGLAR